MRVSMMQLHYSSSTLHSDMAHFDHALFSVHLGTMHFDNKPCIVHITTVHCVGSIGTLPPWTVHLGTMHSNNESCIVHIGTLYFHYALCSFLGCTSSLRYAPCSLKWWVLFCTVHLRMVKFDCARYTIHLGVVQFHYAPCTVHLFTMHLLHEIWTMHLGIMHSYFVVYTSVWCTSTINLALCTLLRWTSTIHNAS